MRRFGPVTACPPPKLVRLALVLALSSAAAPAAAQIATGSYMGNGAANRVITGVGFRPDVVLVKSEGFASAILRTSTMPPGTSKVLVGAFVLGPGLIESLDADGFTVGPATMVNSAAGCSGLPCTYHWIAFKAGADLKIGTYTGDGSASQSVSGIGFSPDYVITMPADARRPLHRTRMGTVESQGFDGAAGPRTDGITSLDANGFTVASSAPAENQNAPGVTYHYVAWNAVPGKVTVGGYTGDGFDDRSITGAGFEPAYVIVQAYNHGLPAVQRTGAMPLGSSVDFLGPLTFDLVQALEADGFQVGSAQPVNGAMASCAAGGPCLYAWVAFAAGCCSLTTTATPDTFTVTAPSSFELTFDTNNGGGVRTFFDLAEDPFRTVDLAGAPTPTGRVKTLFHFGINQSGTWYTPDDATRNPADPRWHGLPPELELLEATPTRVRVRQESFYSRLCDGGGCTPGTLAGVKGYGDYSVYPSGKVALRWRHEITAPVGFSERNLALGLSSDCPMCNNLTPFSQSGSIPPGNWFDDFLLAKRDVPGKKTDFLHILSEDWLQANNVSQDLAAAYLDWRDLSSGPLTSLEEWKFLTYFKPTTFGAHDDPEVSTRAADYRTPDALLILLGSPWLDPSEYTGGADHFNEAEAAYVLDVDPMGGLVFDIHGGPTGRPRPFFKLRQWRSLAPPTSVTVEGVPLTRDLHYKADVKPVSRAHLADKIVWYSTLQDPSAVTGPDVGDTTGSSNGGGFVLARYDRGFVVTGNAEFIRIPTADFDERKGALEFWFQPDYDSTDTTTHDIAGFDLGGANRWLLRKDFAGNLIFLAADAQITVQPTSYRWRAKDWVHIRVQWVEGDPRPTQLRLFLNGFEPPHSDPANDYNAGSLNLPEIRLGKQSSAFFSPGIYDEVYLYAGSEATPTPLAHGGLVGSASEYLADPAPARNFPLALMPVDGMGRGHYLYIGADSMFLGLNVALQTPGAGVLPNALRWEYWNGSAWVTMLPGFQDTTDSLTRNGTISWPSPPSWSVYSVNGGPDLYYVRASLESATTYSPVPVESVIKTDILLLQYCRDVQGGAIDTFVIAPPAPAGTADLAIEKDDGQTTAARGSLVTYTITVTNHGPETVTSVTVNDSLPVGLVGAVFTPSTGTYNSGSGAWTGLNLGAEESVTLTLEGTIDPAAPTPFVNAVTVAPLGPIPDPFGANNSASDSDNLTAASADLSLVKTAPPAVVLGSELDYALTVHNDGPSNATMLQITDRLPAAMEYVSCSPGPGGCSFDPATRTVTFNLAALPAGNNWPVTIRVRAMGTGVITNSASIRGSETDPDPADDTDDATVTVTAAGETVLFFTVTSGATQNNLEWLNPTLAAAPNYISTVIVCRDTPFPLGATPADGTIPFPGATLYTSVAPPGQYDSYIHDVPTPGLTYYYAAFVNLSSGTPPYAVRFNKGRTTNGTPAAVQWAFSMGTTSLAPPGNGSNAIHAVAQDGALYSMAKGAFPAGGSWPAGWWPYGPMNGPSQGRPSTIAYAGQRLVYLGSQDGTLHAIDADRGGAALPFGVEPLDPAGSLVQATPSGIFTAFGGAHDYVLVGTTHYGLDNQFHARRVGDVTSAWSYAGGPPYGAIGIIPGQAAVDYTDPAGPAGPRVYFASYRRNAVASDKTVWCLDLTLQAPCWAAAVQNRDVSTAVTVRKGRPYGDRVYVGTVDGKIYALNAADGSLAWAAPFDTGGDGAVKGGVIADRLTDDLYFATSTKVWAIRDTGPGAADKWAVPTTLASPSTPIYAPGGPHLWVGGGDGKLHVLDAATGAPLSSILLGDGSAAVGSPTLDLRNNHLYVGSEAGVVYAISPIP